MLKRWHLKLNFFSARFPRYHFGQDLSVHLLFLSVKALYDQHDVIAH